MIIVHGKTNCVSCESLKRWLTSKNVDYVYKDLETDHESLKKFQSKGMKTLPIVTVVDEKGNETNAFAGFNINKIMELISSLKPA